MHKPESVLEDDTHKLLWDVEIKTDHQISARRPELIMMNKNERTRRIVDFAVPTNHRVKLKECEKRDEYLEPARDLKKCEMKLTLIPVVISVLGTVTKGLVQGLEE